jgi:hypothetical protein
VQHLAEVVAQADRALALAGAVDGDLLERLDQVGGALEVGEQHAREGVGRLEEAAELALRQGLAGQRARDLVGALAEGGGGGDADADGGVELVGDAGDEVAERGHLLGLDELVAGLAVGLVEGAEDRPARGVAGDPAQLEGGEPLAGVRQGDDGDLAQEQLGDVGDLEQRLHRQALARAQVADGEELVGELGEVAGAEGVQQRLDAAARVRPHLLDRGVLVAGQLGGHRSATVDQLVEGRLQGLDQARSRALIERGREAQETLTGCESLTHRKAVV